MIANVSGYSRIIPIEQRSEYTSSGWTEAPEFFSFGYRPDETQTVVFSVTPPLTLAQIDPQMLVNQTVVGFHTSLGSYGMGGCGFFGLILSDQPDEYRVMVFAVIFAGLYVLMDNREICAVQVDYNRGRPWLSKYANEDIPWDDLSPVLIGSQITSIDISQDHIVLHLSQNGEPHLMEFLRNDPRLPDYPSGKPRENSFTKGTISDHILFIHPKSTLWC